MLLGDEESTYNTYHMAFGRNSCGLHFLFPRSAEVRSFVVVVSHRSESFINMAPKLTTSPVTIEKIVPADFRS